jgi:hypothetical protein
MHRKLAFSASFLLKRVLRVPDWYRNIPFLKASIAKIVGVSLPPFTALSRQGGYAHP